MFKNISQNLSAFFKRILRKFSPSFSFHYVSYTILFSIIVFSAVQIVTATTPNPGHPWAEVGDGTFVVTGPTISRTYTFPNANATILTTNTLVTVAQGGTGAGTFTANGIIYGNGASTLGVTAAGVTGQCLIATTSAAPSWGSCGGSSGLTVGTSSITSGTTGRVLYDNAGILGEMTTTGSGTVLALATSPVFVTPTLGVASGTSLALSSSSTTGADFGLTNSGVYTGTGLINIAANSTATGTVASISATGLTSGTGLSLVGSNVATGQTGPLLNLSGNIGNTGQSAGFFQSVATVVTSTPGAAAPNLYLNTTNANTTNSNIVGGFINIVNDATSLANTVLGGVNNIVLSGNAAKTAKAVSTLVTSSSTTGDNIYGGSFSVTESGAVASGTQTSYGINASASSTGVSGGTANVYGVYASAGGTVLSGTINTYGLYVANGTANTTGTSTKYGLYVASQTGATNNYAGIFAGGNVGIGNTTPSELLTLGTAGVTAGTLSLAGATSGKAIINVSATAGTPTITLPTTTGTLALTASPTFTGTVAGANLALTSVNTTQVTTSSALALNANSLTSGTGLYAASSTLTSGYLADLEVSGTAAAASQTALNILTTGANGTAGITTYGIKVANTHSTNTSSNIGLYATASGGATANYAAIFDQGNVGVGNTTPLAKLTVGDGTGNPEFRLYGDTTGLGGGNAYASLYVNTYGNLQFAGTFNDFFISNRMKMADDQALLFGSSNNYYQAYQSSSGTYFMGTGATVGSGIALAVTSTGNLGIGTGTPTANFQVAQATTGRGTVSNLASGTTVTGVGTQFTNTFKVGDTITIGGQTVAISAIASDTSMTTTAITAANTNVAYTLAGGTRFSILGNGNVGIGNTTPSELLTLGTAGVTAGTLSLAGATSGKAIINVSATAGTPTITLPTTTGTLALTASPTFTGTVTIPSPFTIGATSVTATGTQLNYLASATGTTGTTTTNLVYSTSPTLVTPNIGNATGSGLALTSANTTQVTTSSALALNANSLTSGTGLYVASSSLTSGYLADFEYSGTTANGHTGVNISLQGANATPSVTTVGLGVYNTHSGTGSVNYGLYVLAGSGGSNYAAAFAGGNVGIGNITPSELLTLGTAGSTAGVLSLAGATSGKAIIQVASVAGTPTITLPTTTGTLALTVSPIFTTPNIGAATATTINGNTFTTGSYTLTGTAAKTLNFTNSLTLSGTDSTTMTFPTTTATIARTDAGQTFSGTQVFSGIQANTVDAQSGGSLSIGGSNSSTTTINGSTGISLANHVTLGVNKSLTFSTGSGALTQPYTSALSGSGISQTVTNSNSTVSSVIDNGYNLSLINSTNANNTNTINGINFPAATNTNSNIINGINFASSTGFTNFINSPSFVVTNTGALTALSATLSGFTAANGVVYATSAGVLTQTAAATGAQCLTTSGAGAVPAWGSCGAGGGARLDQITAANTTATIDNLTNAIAWNWSTASTQNPFAMSANVLTTGKLLSLSSSATTTLTTAGTNVGSLLDITESGAMTAFTGSLASINASSASNAVGATGHALSINLAGTAQLMSGINFTDATTGALGTTSGTSGGTLFAMTGAHTGYGFQISDVTQAGQALIVNANSLTTGKGISIVGGTAMTTGGDLDVNGAVYIHTTAETGMLASMTFSDASTNTSGASNTNGLYIASTVNTSGAGTKMINGINVAAPTLTACTSGACSWDGLMVNTQSTALSTVTQNGLHVVSSGISAGTLNGIYIPGITPGAGTETALNIGSGWDTAINANGNIIIGAQTDTASTGTSTATLNSAAGTFGASTANDRVTSSVVYRGKLFVAVAKTNAAGVYRYDGGTTWTLVTNAVGKAVVGDAVDADAFIMAVYNDQLYIANQTGAATGAIYRSSTADTTADSFTMVNATRGTSGMSQTAITGYTSMVVYNGQLIVADQIANAAEIGRYDGGSTFTQITATDGKSAAETTADKDGFILAVYDGYLYSGSITGSTTNIIAAWNGNSTTWTNLSVTLTGGSYGADTAYSDTTSMVVYNGNLYISMSKTAGNAAAVYMLKTTTTPVANVAANFIRVNTTVGKLIAGDAADQDSIILYVYNERLYGASATGSTTAAIYEYPQLGAGAQDWTLMNTTRGTFGSDTGVDSVTSMIEYNGVLYIGTFKTGAGSVYTWTKTSKNSFGLLFDSGGGNYGNIEFVGGSQALGSNGHEGSFNFSHAITLSTGAFDYAEDYQTFDTTLEAGDVVAVDEKNVEFIKRADGTTPAIGIYSKNPGLRLQKPKDVQDVGQTWVPIALVGRVPLKVSTENGEIHPGDSLTLSLTIPGVAMKATKAGTIIARSLSAYSGPGVGIVSSFIDNSYSTGTKLSDTIPGVTIDGVTTSVPAADLGKTALAYFVAQHATLANQVTLSEITTDRLVAGLEIITPQIYTNNLLVTGTAEFVLPPLFNKDTAGFAVIKQGDRRVKVIYNTAYIATPVVTANVAFDATDNISDDTASQLFDQHIQSLVVTSDQNGFTILINQNAPRDLRFSWNAFAVRDPHVFESVIEGLVINQIPESTPISTTPPDTSTASTPSVTSQTIQSPPPTQPSVSITPTTIPSTPPVPSSETPQSSTPVTPVVPAPVPALSQDQASTPTPTPTVTVTPLSTPTVSSNTSSPQ